jgi:glutathione synthase
VNNDKIEQKESLNEEIPFCEFNVAFVRKDPPFDEDYITLCWLLSSQQKVRILNSAESLLNYHEKSLPWRALNEKVLTDKNIIPTCFTNSISVIDKFCRDFSTTEKFIAKPWLGHGGEDIYLYENKEHLLDDFKKNNRRHFLVQPFLPNITSEGDRRVIIANGHVVCDYVRLPATGKIASNGAQGGSAILREMTESQKNICEKMAQFLKEKNIYFAGLDLIGEYVGEVNITSPTGIRTYEALSQKNVSLNIINLLMEK